MYFGFYLRWVRNVIHNHIKCCNAKHNKWKRHPVSTPVILGDLSSEHDQSLIDIRLNPHITEIYKRTGVPKEQTILHMSTPTNPYRNAEPDGTTSSNRWSTRCKGFTVAAIVGFILTIIMMIVFLSSMHKDSTTWRDLLLIIIIFGVVGLLWLMCCGTAIVFCCVDRSKSKRTAAAAMNDSA